MLCTTADKDCLRPWLLDSDSSSNASSQIPAGIASEDQDLQDAIFCPDVSTSSHLCDPEVASAQGFWMDVGTAVNPKPEPSGDAQR